MNLEQARFNMIQQQIRPWDVLDPKILDLLMDIPRHLFVKESEQSLAYSDIELPISENQTMWFPRVEAKFLQAVDVDSSENVLEVGTGSGYLTALLASQAQSVTTIDLSESLQASAKERLSNFDNISYYTGDASQNWNDAKLYDVIILTGATAEVPEAYKTKLTLGGRLAVVTGKSPAMSAQIITRIADGEWDSEVLFETDMAYLTHAEPKASFAF